MYELAKDLHWIKNPIIESEVVCKLSMGLNFEEEQIEQSREKNES